MMYRPKLYIALVFTILSSQAPLRSQKVAPKIPSVESHRVCALSTVPHVMSCGARVVTSSLNGLSKASGFIGLATPSGYGPADLQSAYNLTSLSSSAGTGQTIAIVDAYDDPNAEADLAVYRSTFGLPPCTSASGCFQKVNQSGATSPLPSSDGGWAEEMSLDLDIVSAICPNCNLLLVEANSPTNANFDAAVKTAATWPGIAAVSLPWGDSEDSSASSDCESSYNYPGVAIAAAAGDEDFFEGTFTDVLFPASCHYVTAVGGTSLVRNNSTARGWSESVWNTTNGSEGTGSGCSSFITKPAWQTDTSCKKRMTNDVSAVADPATGVAVYDTYANADGTNGWAQFAGTQVATNLIAGVYALAAPAAPGDYPASYAYAKARSPEWEHAGILGPVLRAEVGDTIRILFKNNASRPCSMHPHGVFYGKDSEGAPYDDGTSGKEKDDDAVPPGKTHVYTWQVPERAGPGPNGPSSIVWLYHSHTNELKDVQSGLVGARIIPRRGMANEMFHCHIDDHMDAAIATL
jgi:Multicopper oxidase